MVNYEKLNGFLIKEIWTGIYSVDVNESYNSFIDKITSVINKSTTIRTLNSKQKHLKEWMSRGLLNSVRRKNYLSLKVNKHPINEKLHSYYIKYKNNFTKNFKNRQN